MKEKVWIWGGMGHKVYSEKNLEGVLRGRETK